jgi:hypothetical protein
MPDHDTTPPPPLPKYELDLLVDAVTEAIDLAESGEVLNGYRCLLGGLERATESEEAGDAHGPELVRRYRLALERYGERWGVKIE